MKKLVWLGDSKRTLKTFSVAAQSELGFELQGVQEGAQPSDSKAMPSIGPGVEEVRVWVESGTYRVIYIARRPEAVYVLHAFQKKSQKTSQSDVELARKRLASLS